MSEAAPTSAARYAIERLGAGHGLEAFDCGVAALNDYLVRFAGQNDRRGLGRTFVAVPVGAARVAGYYTLAAGSVRAEVLPPAAARRLPRYPVPVVLLGRLAVDRAAQGAGLGGALLFDALQRALRGADAVGIHAVEVVAKDAGARAFYARHGFAALQDDPLHLYLPLQTVRTLVDGRA